MLQQLRAAWHQGQLSDLALHFADLIARLDPVADEKVLLGAALTSQYAVSGEVCVNLGEIAGTSVLVGVDGREIIAPKLSSWLTSLRRSSVVGTNDAYQPLVLENDNRLYLYQYRNLEARLATALRSRAEAPDFDVDPARLNRALSIVFPVVAEAVEQREAAALAIRRPFAVISGGPGTGKTTVALHRVAYLAFDDPRIDGPETLVVVFSPALRNFVSHVLPSLGLSRVRIVSYREWVGEERRRHFRNISPSVRNDTTALAQRIKLHPFLSLALQRYIESHPGAPTAERALDDWAGVLCEEELLLSTARELEPEWEAETEIRKFVHGQRIQLESFFAGLGGDESALVELDPEDDALLLRAWQLRVGPLRAGARKPLRLRHLVIDEVQDFSALEVQVLLGCMDSEASITLAGDTHQHVMKHSGFSSWTEFFRPGRSWATPTPSLDGTFPSRTEDGRSPISGQE